MIVLVLYTDEHSKTTEKPGVLSFSPWIGCQTHVCQMSPIPFLSNPDYGFYEFDSSSFSSSSIFGDRSPAEVEALEILTSYGQSATFVTTILSLLLNSLVVAIVLHQRRTDHRSWGQLHLLFLAASDLLIGFVYLWGCLWRFSLGGDSLVEVALPANFLLHYKVFSVFWVMGIGLNRWLTLFFTCVKV